MFYFIDFFKFDSNRTQRQTSEYDLKVVLNLLENVQKYSPHGSVGD